MVSIARRMECILRELTALTCVGGVYSVPYVHEVMHVCVCVAGMCVVRGEEEELCGTAWGLSVVVAYVALVIVVSLCRDTGVLCSWPS